MLDLIWVIPLLPIVGVLINGFYGRRMTLKAVGVLASATVGLAFLLSLGAVWQLSRLDPIARIHEVSLGTWIPLGTVNGVEMVIDWGFRLDALSAVLLLVVTGVGLLIHIYSIGYMNHEEDYARFFVYLNLFMAMMLTLTLGSNLLVLFVGWEGVGLCSYLLIGFFYDKPFDERTGLSCADAGRKAFIVNRIGDLAFLIGILYIAFYFGTLNFGELDHAMGHASGSGALLTGIGLLLFIGACGKSAQIPLYVWLPDAMAGPTPVSALIHAATMVTAGVYMVCRMSTLYSAAPEAAAVVASVGAATALFAAIMGMCATDIKKVLAYSTVSQLGYMFAAAGVGAYIAGMFHLMTHAFFKGLLFLGAGSVIHGLSGVQDIRKMGGLKAKMPKTAWTFVVGMLAISGIPIFAGFFSKDEILAGAWAGGHRVVWGVLLVSAAITAFYMTRMTWLTFFGDYRGDKATWDRVHESPSTMTTPLIILAALATVGGLVGVPVFMTAGKDLNFFHHWLAPAITLPGGIHGAEHAEAAAHGGAAEWLLVFVAVAAAVSGIFVAFNIYRTPGRSDGIARATGPLHVAVRNLFWVDEFYERVVLRPFYAMSRAFSAFDRWVVDGLVNFAGIIADIAGQFVKLFQTGLVRNYALIFLVGVVAILFYLASV
jgi:NADH-quinone oxidoreductase subunit L